METDANNLVDRDPKTNAMIPVIQSYSKDLENTEVRSNYLYVRGKKNAFIPVVKIVGGADKIDELIKAINNIQIGGENLICNSTLRFGYLDEGTGKLVPYNAGVTAYDYAEEIYKKIPLQYTSMTGTVYFPYLKPMGVKGLVTFYDKDKKYITYKVWCSGDKVNGISKPSTITFDIPNTAEYYRYSIIHKDLVCKLEFGNKTTDYSISTIDINSQLIALSTRVKALESK